jgi:hypothetical protein
MIEIGIGLGRSYDMSRSRLDMFSYKGQMSTGDVYACQLLKLENDLIEFWLLMENKTHPA